MPWKCLVYIFWVHCKSSSHAWEIPVERLSICNSVVHRHFPFLSISPFRSFSLGLGRSIRSIFVLRLYVACGLRGIFMSVVSSNLGIIYAVCVWFVIFLYYVYPFKGAIFSLWLGVRYVCRTYLFFLFICRRQELIVGVFVSSNSAGVGLT